jgi:hypothetical protein
LTIIIVLCYNKVRLDKVKTSSALGYMTAFKDADYIACDKCSGDMKLLDSNIYIENNEYRELILKSLSKSIRKVSLVSTSKTSEGTSYMFKVNYAPFKSITKLSTKGISVNDTVSKYLQGELSDSDIATMFDTVYLDLFKSNCFEVQDKEKTMSITLLEKDTRTKLADKSKTKVFGVDDFLDSLLSKSNLKNNIDIYESTKLSTVSDLTQH